MTRNATRKRKKQLTLTEGLLVSQKQSTINKNKKRCLKIIMTRNATRKRKNQLTRTEGLLNNKRIKNKESGSKLMRSLL